MSHQIEQHITEVAVRLFIRRFSAARTPADAGTADAARTRQAVRHQLFVLWFLWSRPVASRCLAELTRINEPELVPESLNVAGSQWGRVVLSWRQAWVLEQHEFGHNHAGLCWNGRCMDGI